VQLIGLVVHVIMEVDLDLASLKKEHFDQLSYGQRRLVDLMLATDMMKNILIRKHLGILPPFFKEMIDKMDAFVQQLDAPDTTNKEKPGIKRNAVFATQGLYFYDLTDEKCDCANCKEGE